MSNITTNFDDWLSGLDLEDFEDVHCLWSAVSERETRGTFDCRVEGEMTFVSSNCETTQTLKLVNEAAREGFIKLLEGRFGGELGIDGTYYFNRQMEKMD